MRHWLTLAGFVALTVSINLTCDYIEKKDKQAQWDLSAEVELFDDHNLVESEDE